MTKSQAFAAFVIIWGVFGMWFWFEHIPHAREVRVQMAIDNAEALQQKLKANWKPADRRHMVPFR